MGDGAHMGITAGRALGTILGGDDQPTTEERATPEEVRARIEAAPLFEGPKPWENVEAGLEPNEDRMAAYNTATDSIAHAFLVLIEEDPSLLEPGYWPEDESVAESIRGRRRDQASVVWDALEKRWPHADEWVGGPSGFMVGFALNTALYVTGWSSAGNPALMTIGPKEDE